MLFPVYAESGGLLSYGPDNLDLLQQTGVLVGKVLTGSRPETLPAELPTRFRLLVNLQTAQALGVTVPRSLLVSADKVIR